MMVLLFEGHPGPHLGEGPGVDGHGRAPLGHPDKARLDEVEAFEEPAYLRTVARRALLRHQLVQAAGHAGHVAVADVRGRVADHHVAARRQRADQLADQLAGLLVILDQVQDRGQDDRDRLTQIVMSESDRLNSIISDFLAYARPRPLSLERIDVAGVLEEVLMLLEHRPLPPTVKVVRAFEAPLSAHADPNALRQALWNLCLNAVDAMPDGGELTVGATVVASTLHLSVADTGRGIAPGDVSHIFEPFYSTKPEGSGLGLALVHRIVRDHDGDVEVRTDPRTGTIFTLTLPLGVHV